VSNPFSSGPSVVQSVAPAIKSAVVKPGEQPAKLIEQQQRLAKAQRENTIIGARGDAAPLYNATRLGAGA